MRISAAIRCSAVFLVAASGLSAAASFTLEQVLNVPFPRGLVASPSGDAIAWVSDAAGVRNVMIARAPAFEPVAVTTFTRDDGQDINGLAWGRGSRMLAFARGVNPEIWIASDSTPAAKVADGRAPVFSPDGSRLVWLLRGQVWSTAVEGSRVTGSPAQLFTARGTASDLQWSPDSSSLAFVSTRGDHAFIGIYSPARNVVEFPDPSADTDANPSWSPDGSMLAFTRSPAFFDATRWGQSPRPEGDPWSIRLIAVGKRENTGQGKELWRANPGQGSVFQSTAAARQLIWVGADRLVFPWEGDGWLHLYRIVVSGGSASRLTSGDFEVESFALAIGGAELLVSSNQGDLDRRHIWRVPVDGRPVRQITSGGIEAAPTPLVGNRLAFVRATATESAGISLMEADRTRDLEHRPLVEGLIEPQAVTVSSPDGQNIHGQLFLPRDGGRHPAVVFFHGGPRRQMLLGFHTSEYYHRAYAFNQYLASRGYVVLSVNYRSGTGYGLKFREVPNYGATGAAEYADVLGAAAYLRARADVDSTHIGLWGGSYGGYLTGLGLARNSDLFAAGVEFHGIFDYNLELPEDLPRSAEAVRTAFESSPAASIAKWRSPVLLVHGDDDHEVAFSQTVRAVEALRKQGVPFEQIVFPDEAHEFLIHAHWLEAYRAAEAFLGKYLKP